MMLRDPAQHFRLRAEEARTIAESMSDPCNRIFMFNVAKEYEYLAAREAASSAKRRACRDVEGGLGSTDPKISTRS